MEQSETEGVYIRLKEVFKIAINFHKIQTPGTGSLMYFTGSQVLV